MHRHGYQGRKLSRERDQRRALIRSLSVALVEHGSIETTLPKAKELRPDFEKLVSKAKKGGLHDRRQIVSKLGSVPAAHKLVEQIAPAMKRTSGYLRIERTSLRRGDNAQLARISFVDDIPAKVEVKNVENKPVAKVAAATKKPAASKARAATKPTAAKKPSANARAKGDK